jgi:hypothetical protein
MNIIFKIGRKKDREKRKKKERQKQNGKKS